MDSDSLSMINSGDAPFTIMNKYLDSPKRYKKRYSASRWLFSVFNWDIEENGGVGWSASQQHILPYEKKAAGGYIDLLLTGPITSDHACYSQFKKNMLFLQKTKKIKTTTHKQDGDEDYSNMKAVNEENQNSAETPPPTNSMKSTHGLADWEDHISRAVEKRLEAVVHQMQKQLEERSCQMQKQLEERSCQMQKQLEERSCQMQKQLEERLETIIVQNFTKGTAIRDQTDGTALSMQEKGENPKLPGDITAEITQRASVVDISPMSKQQQQSTKKRKRSSNKKSAEDANYKLASNLSECFSSSNTNEIVNTMKEYIFRKKKYDTLKQPEHPIGAIRCALYEKKLELHKSTSCQIDRIVEKFDLFSHCINPAFVVAAKAIKEVNEFDSSVGNEFKNKQISAILDTVQDEIYMKRMMKV
jgi:hypothetical protein